MTYVLDWILDMWMREAWCDMSVIHNLQYFHHFAENLKADFNGFFLVQMLRI